MSGVRGPGQRFLGFTPVPVQLKSEGGHKVLRRSRRQKDLERDVSKERRHWSSEDKIKLLRQHLIERVPISTICEEARLAPSLFHRWQEQLFGNAALALEGKVLVGCPRVIATTPESAW